MREATRRPGAQADGEGPQSADADAAGGEAGAGGEPQRERAQMRRAQKRREASADAEADAFNQRHAAEVAEFNQRTGEACVGEDGKLDAAMVREWQREHGVAPDGKVGPKTLAAAGGTKTDQTKEDGDNQLAKPAAAADKAKPGRGKSGGPLEEITSWLDAPTVKLILDELKALTGKGGEKHGPVTKDEVKQPEKATDTGLASALSIEHFVQAAKKLERESEWQDKSPHERAAAFVKAANDQLAGAGVRHVGFNFSADCSAANPARFDHASWKLLFFRRTFEQRRLNGKDGAQLADDVYHESRHAEQNYRIVQSLAGQHKTPEEIYAATGIDKETIAAASSKPIAGDTPEAQAAQQMFQDKYVHQQQHRDAEARAKALFERYNPIRAVVDDPSASADQKAEAQKQVDAMRAEVIEAWNAYITLATESDANAVGGAVQAAMLKK